MVKVQALKELGGWKAAPTGPSTVTGDDRLLVPRDCSRLAEAIFAVGVEPLVLRLTAHGSRLTVSFLRDCQCLARIVDVGEGRNA